MHDRSAAITGGETLSTSVLHGASGHTPRALGVPVDGLAVSVNPVRTF
jgi:hypothetical protein